MYFSIDGVSVWSEIEHWVYFSPSGNSPNGEIASSFVVEAHGGFSDPPTTDVAFASKWLDGESFYVLIGAIELLKSEV